MSNYNLQPRKLSIKNNEYMIKKILPEYHIVFKPAIKNGFDGRPSNGMFIAIPTYLKENVTDVSPKSTNIQGIIIKENDTCTLLLNTYFPTDPRKDDFDDTELQLLLSDVSTTIDKSGCDEVILAGGYKCRL